MDRRIFQLSLVLVTLLQNYQLTAGGWFFSKEDQPRGQDSENNEIPKNVVAEFSMEPLNNKKGMQLVENARTKIELSSNTCWQNAYKNIFAGCTDILAGVETRSRLAWHLSDCFQKDSGRPEFPYCAEKSPMVNCLKNLNVDAHKVYLEFYLETNSICHQLQADAFKRQMERLVNELKMTAEDAEIKIENIDERTGQILKSSNEIFESLAMVDLHTTQVARTLLNVTDHVSAVLTNSEAVYEQSVALAASQEELRKGQAKMNETLVEGMAMVHDSYKKLGEDISSLGDKAIELENEIDKVGEAMSSKMNTLQSKAEDIGNITEVSLDKQSELLAGQSAAAEGLRKMNNIMSQTLEESKGTMQQLAEFGHRQQDELLNRQKQLEKNHNNLIENSKTILEAQESFESKQANMFQAIDKLFALHNAILLESRLIKAFIVYTVAMFVIYMLTSTKQTYNVRPRLYIGLCVTFVIEFFVLKYWANGIEHQEWITRWTRMVSALLALAQLAYAIYTYRDYETLNHQMLQTLVEKFNRMQKHGELTWDTDSDEEDWSKWIDADLPNDVDKLVDPDFLLPGEVGEDSLAISSAATRNYNLRSRHHS